MSIGPSLALRRPRPPWHLKLLVGANVAWVIVSVVLVASVASTAGVLGLVHIIAEGLYVLVLALCEWRYRSAILAT